ncbi:MAG: type I DNA topoisomerase, partial [Patescibacteria group bacterium]
KALKELEGATYVITKVEKKESHRNPAPPFITSTLQQEAGRKLGFSVKKTMTLAQRLYEGIDLNGEHEGLITYMRTDSVNLSDLALKQAQEVVTNMYGKPYALEEPRRYKGRKGAQEAHEAIRPTEFSRTPESLSKHLEKDELRLYDLIWKRALASQMTAALLDKVGVDIEANEYNFRATGQTVRFDGFIKVYMEGRDLPEEEEEDKENRLPPLEEGEKPRLEKLIPEQHFTKPPPRYTEASLVKAMEAEGIGRPSTYAPTISTVQARGYIVKEEKALKPTEIGSVVSDFLVEHFPKIVEFKFTARMEEMLDEIEEGKEPWQAEIKEFYVPFHDMVE